MRLIQSMPEPIPEGYSKKAALKGSMWCIKFGPELRAASPYSVAAKEGVFVHATCESFHLGPYRVLTARIVQFSGRHWGPLLCKDRFNIITEDLWH